MDFLSILNLANMESVVVMLKTTDIYEYKGILVSLECTQQGAEENYTARCSLYFDDYKDDQKLMGVTDIDSWKQLVNEYIDEVILNEN